MVVIQSGAVKFKSATAAFKVAHKRNPKLKWMTFYMRIRAGQSFAQASYGKVRKYKKTVH